MLKKRPNYLGQLSRPLNRPARPFKLAWDPNALKPIRQARGINKSTAAKNNRKTAENHPALICFCLWHAQGNSKGTRVLKQMKKLFSLTDCSHFFPFLFLGSTTLWVDGSASIWRKSSLCTQLMRTRTQRMRKRISATRPIYQATTKGYFQGKIGHFKLVPES